MEPRFKDWLARALDEEGVSRRELARRIAERHPEGANESTVESARTTIREILSGKRKNPGQPLRNAIQAALGRDDAPSEADEVSDQSLSREEIVGYLRELRRDTFRLERAILAGAIR